MNEPPVPRTCLAAPGYAQRRRPRSQFLLLLALLALTCGSAWADDWPGWRGLGRQGRAEGPGPVEWSPDRNVRWKTPILGEGHSSPIVVGDRAIVTTAYSTPKGAVLKERVARATVVFGAILGILAVWLVGRRAKAEATGGLVRAGCACCSMGLALHFLVAAVVRLGLGKLGNDARTECWLFTSLGACLLLLVAASASGARSWLRLVPGLAALGLAWLIVAARPAPEYFDLTTPGRYGPDTLLTVVFPWLVVTALVLAALPRRRPAGAAPDTTKRRLPPLLACALAFLVGLLAFGLPLVLVGMRLARGLPIAGETESAMAAFVVGFGDSSMQVAGAGILIWLIGEWAGRRASPPLPGRAVVVVLVLGAMAFAERNVLTATEQFVRAVICVDRDTGAVRWVREALPGPQPSVNHRNSPATPTPVSDGERVYAWFGSAGCLCTDLDGNVLWTNTDVPFEDVHGVAASPMPADGLLVLVGGQPKAPYIAALDPTTGERVWTVGLEPWPGIEGQHRTPTIATLDGRPVVLYWGWEGADKVDSLWVLDARTGAMLWRHPVETHGEAVASVLVEGDVLYLPGQKTFRALSLAKLAAGDDPVLWTADLKGKGPYASSPVLAKGLLFMVANHRHAWCLDAKTGAVQWQERVKGRGAFPSPVAAGGRIYFCDKSGLTTVVSADRSFRVLAENELGEPIWASPAAAAGRLIIRTTKHLWCIE